MYGEFDFVAYKIKYGDELPMADIDSTVSMSLIALIHVYSHPLYIPTNADFVAPEDLS